MKQYIQPKISNHYFAALNSICDPSPDASSDPNVTVPSSSDLAPGRKLYV